MDIPVFYPNMMKLFMGCPFKYYFRYVEQIPTPLLDKGFITGKNIHSLASYYLKGSDLKKFEKVLSEKEQTMWNILKQTPYFTYEVLGTEKAIVSKIDDFYIGGRVDALVKNNKDYYLLDYKTGGVDEDMTYDPQTMVYLLLCDGLIKDYSSLFFVYLDLKNNKEVRIEFSEKLKNQYCEKITDIIGKIKNFNPTLQEKVKDCKCEYLNICRVI